MPVILRKSANLGPFLAQDKPHGSNSETAPNMYNIKCNR